MEALALVLLAGAPWLVATAWLWHLTPRTDAIPPSWGEQMRQRLEA